MQLCGKRGGKNTREGEEEEGEVGGTRLGRNNPLKSTSQRICPPRFDSSSPYIRIARDDNDNGRAKTVQNFSLRLFYSTVIKFDRVHRSMMHRCARRAKFFWEEN